jgi:uracil-DNA glycosylase
MPPHPTPLLRLHAQLAACRLCPKMLGPVVHGPPVTTPVFLLGQAPGPHEGTLGRPFAWTAGKTLFRWFHDALGADEARIRQAVYFAAVARCFPGKAKGGGDRKPDAVEVAACRPWIAAEVQVLQPKLVLPVGALAIAEVLGHTGPLKDVIGLARRATFHGVEVDVIALPHPSGASTWHRMEPGKSLLARALSLLKKHPAMREALTSSS